MWHWSWILLVACFLFAGYIVRWLFLGLFARYLGVQEVKIQTLHALGLGGISHLEWEGNEVTWDNAQDRQELLQRSVVTVKRIKPHTDKDAAANKRFIGILVEGVTIKIPKAHLAHQFEKLQSSKSSHKQKTEQSAEQSAWDASGRMPGDPLFPSVGATKTRWQAISKALGRGALLTFRWLRSLIFRRLLFGIRFVDVQITVQEVCQLDLNLSVGVQHVDTVRCLNAPIEAYLAASEVTLSEFASQSANTMSSSSPAPSAAFELPRSVWFSVRTSDLHHVSLWNVARRRIDPRSFRFDLKFPQHEILRGSEQRHESRAASGMSDIFIQLDKVLALFDIVQKELQKAQPKTRSRGYARDDPDQRPGFTHSRRRPFSPIHYVNAVFFDLPSIECQYAPSQLDDQVVLRTKLTGVKVVAALGENFPKQSNEYQIAGLENGHRRWLGSSDTIPLALQAQWQSWTWDVQTPIAKADGRSTPSPADLATSQLRIGQLKLALTLNFAFWHHVDDLQKRIICEARLKSSFLDLRHETVETVLQRVAPVLMSRQRSQPMQLSKSAKTQPAASRAPSRLWPRVVFHVDLDECSLRFLGPDTPSSRGSGWTSGQQVRLKTPPFSVTSESEYKFLSIPLSGRRLQEAKDQEQHQQRIKERRERAQTIDQEAPSSSSASRYKDSSASTKTSALFAMAQPSKSTFKDSIQNLEDDVAFDSHYSALYEVSFSLASSHSVQLLMESMATEGQSAASSGWPYSSTDHSYQDSSTLPSTTPPDSHRILSLGPISCDTRAAIPLRDDGVLYTLQPDFSTVQSDASLERIELAVWQNSTLSLLEDLSRISPGSPPDRDTPDHDTIADTSANDPSPASPVQDHSHPLLRHFSQLSARCHVEAIALEMCGQDPLRDPDLSRGLVLLVRDLCLSMDAARQWAPDPTEFHPRLQLRLPTGSWSDAGKCTVARVGDGLAASELRFSKLTVNPVFDAVHLDEIGGPIKEDPDDLPAFTSPHDFLRTYSGGKPPNDWEYLGRHSFAPQPNRAEKTKKVNREDTRVLTVGSTSVRTTLRHATGSPKEDESLSSPRTTVQTKARSSVVAVSFKLFHVYCCLVSASALKRIAAVHRRHSQGESQSAKTSCTTSTWSLELPRFFVLMTFAEGCELHFQATNIDCRGPDTLLDFEHLHAAAPSPTTVSQWNTLLELQDCRLRIPKDPLHISHDLLIKLQGHSLRLRIPYKYQLWQVVDQIVSNVKACKQLYYNLLLGYTTSVLEPQAEGPKHLPRFEIAMNEVAMEAEDDPMENRLNLSRRVGVFEAQMRQERAAALEARDQQSYLDPDEANALYAAAQEHLRQYDASEWIRRFRNAIAEQSKREAQLLHKLEGHHSHDVTESPLPLTSSKKECPLARATFTDFKMQVRAPSFLLNSNGVKDFLQEVGDMPQDRDLCLLVPLHVHWTVSDAKMTLRDYPLPLLRIPRASSSRHSQRAAWDFEADIVIAEQVPHQEAIRTTVEELVPAAGGRAGHNISIPRSGMPTQMYGRPRIHLASHHHVMFGWGNSMQPALSDVARVVDSLSKPPMDPSPRLGFWDKLPLVIHGNLTITSDADLHLHMKGSRDPYALSGAAAGFVKIWQGNVEIRINHQNKDRELVQILSDKYILAVPDLQHYDDAAAAGLDFHEEESDTDTLSRHAPPENWKGVAPDVKIDKTLGILVNGVRWGMGFRFERTCARGHCPRSEPCEGNRFQRKCRFFEFKPHYDVFTRIEPGPKDKIGRIKDSFAEYRSDFVHFSLSLMSPLPERMPPPSQFDSATNGLRLAPLMDQHFWRWWGLFDSSLSLPVRTGKVFRSPPPAPKFGRATATLKYRFDVRPFFIVHTYRQEATVDWQLGKTTVLGLKNRCENLKIDLHQRTEEFTLQRKELGSKRIYHKKFYRAEVHGDDVDARLVAARFDNPVKAIVAEASEYIDTATAALDETGRETSWIDSIPPLPHKEKALWEDYEDFTDLGPQSLGDEDVIKVVPLMTSPACTYDMQPVPLVSSHQSNLGRPPPKDSAPRSSKFGYEGSHTCLVGNAPKPMAIQLRTVEARIQTLEELLAKDDGAMLPDAPHTRRQELEKRIKTLDKLKDHYKAVARKAKEHQGRPLGQGLETLFGHMSGQDDPEFAAALLDDQDNYSQKLRLHQPHIQVNTVSRDVLLKYWDSSRARKGLNYQLSASVLAQMRKIETEVKMRSPPSPNQPQEEAEGRSSEAIDHAVSACHSVSWADMAAKQYEQRDASGNTPGHKPPSHDASEGVNPDWAVESQFLAIFGQPQFHLKSDTDEGAEAVVTTKLAVLRTFAVSDPETEDDINSTVLHRNYGELRMVQIFYPQRDRIRSLYREAAGVFIPMEVLLDGTARYECDCLVGSTHLSMRYDKFNRLRMTNVGRAQFAEGAPEAFHHGRDEVTVSVGEFEMAATHLQFAALMHIFQKLTLYTNPDRKRKNERLETARLAADYSDAKVVMRWIEERQKIIRRLFDTVSRSDPESGDLNFYSNQAEALYHTEELNTFLQAMQEAHDQQGGERKQQKGDLSIRAKSSQIVLTMLQPDHSPFVKAAIKEIGFNWRSQEDGSVSNQLVIGSISANNYLADSQFIEILYPVDDATLDKDFPLKGKNVVLAAMWSVLPPIGGVAVVEDLQLYLHPINLLLERRMGHLIWEYFFNAKGEVTKTAEREKSRNQSRLPPSSSTPRFGHNLSVPSSGSPVPSASSSTSSLAKGSQSFTANGRSLRSSKSSDGLEHTFSQQWDEEIGSGLSQSDIASMRERARTYRTFLRVDVPDTVIFLTYKHHLDKGSWKDLFGLEFKTPHFSYANRAWSWHELAAALKKDAKTHLLGQTGTLINQAFTKARNPKNVPSPTSVIKKLRNGIRTGEVIHEEDDEGSLSRQASAESRGASLSGKPLSLSSSRNRQASAPPPSSPPIRQDENGAMVDPSLDVSPPLQHSRTEKRQYAIKAMQLADAAIEHDSESDEEPRSPHSPEEANDLFSDESQRSDSAYGKESKREKLLHRLPKFGRKSHSRSGSQGQQ